MGKPPRINAEGVGRLPAFSHASLAGDTIYVVEGEKLPIVQVLERLKDRMRHEQRPSHLLESIERWQSFYAAPK